MKRIVPAFIALLALAPVASLAQDASPDAEAYLELLRSDINTQKVAILTEVLQLNADQSATFWPIHREYQNERNLLSDQRIALLKSYADVFDKMDDLKAKELAKQAFKFDEYRIKIKKKYFDKVSKGLGATTAAKFIQAENQIDLLLDLQVAKNLPLIQSAVQ